MALLAVLTRDLRIHDNPVLDSDVGDAIPLFVADPTIERIHASPNRQAYLAESLAALAQDVESRHGRLVYRIGQWVDTVLGCASEAGATRIQVARDVSGLAQSRLGELARRSPLPVHVVDSITVVPPGAIHPASGDGYRVFTPYFRRWEMAPRRGVVDAPDRFADHAIGGDPLPPPPTRGTSPQREAGGESSARDRMASWLLRASAYEEVRNDLAADATSHLSSALHFGTISPLEVSLAASEMDAHGFVRQIAWRDFNHQILWNRPDAARRDFRATGWTWKDDRSALRAWQSGETGYPVVDAAMRQLLATGWMHNRARMIAASFLTKDLMIDWRVGARWFMTWLTDGDVANNQLGWQWVAGTGTDTNPTRIFNPTLQSRRFDPDGVYIRRWVPELAEVGGDEIHDPGPLTRAATGYPLPIIDHQEAIRSYKHARGWS